MGRKEGRVDGMHSPAEMMEFIQKCDYVEIADNVMTFRGYHGERDEYHGDLGWWEYDDETIFDLVREYLVENKVTIEELTDDELHEIISEEMSCHGLTYGSGGNGSGDYETVYYSTDFYQWSEEKEWTESFLKDNDKVYYIEVYPYRYGTYSGVYDMKKLEFTEFDCDGDSSPCGGPDANYGVAGDGFIAKLRRAL